MRLFVLFSLCHYLAQIFVIPPAIAGDATIDDNSKDEINKIDLTPKIIEDSPVLRKWLDEIPNVLEDIDRDPAFNSRLRLGFTTFPSNNDAVGLNLGIEDIFIKRSGFTLSADYQTAFNGDRNAAGVDLHYFLLPLGSYFNFAPLVGYRYIQSNDFFTDGVRVGLRLMLALSRTGGGDISLSQSFVAPGSDREVGITSFSVGYAIAPRWRLSGDIERQNSVEDRDNRFSLGLEWLF